MNISFKAPDKSGAGALEIRFLSRLDEIAALEPAWNALAALAQDHEAGFFQSFAWSLQVARVRTGRAPGTFRPLVALVLRGGRLIGLWPLSIRNESRLRVVRSLDDPFGQFAGVLFAAREDVAEGVAAVIAALRADPSIDLLRIEKAVEGSALHDALGALPGSFALSGHSVYLDLSPYADFRGFLRNVNSKTRKNLRNAMNRLQREFTVASEFTDDRGRLAALIADSFDTKLEWMREMAKTAPAFRDPDFRPLVESLARAEPPLPLAGFELKASGRTIAMQWGFSVGTRYYAYISARDLAYDAYSPGRLHLGLVIEKCMERGFDAIELMSPASDYKLNWTSTTKRIDDYTLPLSRRGRIWSSAWTNGLRPALKSAYHAMPAPLRRMFNRNLETV